MRFKKNDLVICKPEEDKRNDSNKNFEIYARVVVAETGNVMLDRYMKNGSLSITQRLEVPEEKYFEGGKVMYQPMNKQEMRLFQKGLRANPNCKRDIISQETLNVVTDTLKEKDIER